MSKSIFDIYELNKKDPFTFLKNNFSVLVLIPTILGGVWQLYMLISIDVRLIRYFSITQIIPDGLLILVIEILVVLISILISRFIVFLLEKIYKTKNLQPVSWIWAVYISIITGTIFMVTSLFFVRTVAIISLCIYITVLIYSMNYLQHKYGGLGDKKTNESLFKINIITLLNFLSIYCVFIILLQISLICNKIDNLENFQNLISDIKKDKNKIDIKLLYSNDKYHFIQYKNAKSKKGKILILPFDNLFEKKTI